MRAEDSDLLMTWARSNNAAYNTAIAMVSLPENASEITIDEILGDIESRGLRPDRRKVTAALRGLEQLQFGELIPGRRNNSGSRFVSAIGIQVLGSVALGRGSSDAQDNTVLHRFTLRPGFEASVRLPANLTVAEAERLAGFIRLLPFEKDGDTKERGASSGNC